MKYHIDNDRLVVNGKPVRYVPTKHMGGRIEPTLIILHDTAGGPPGNSLGWLTSNPKQGSAHLIIERGGAAIQLAEFDRKTNHAGVSVWKGRQGCNGYAIGIEIVNPGALSGTPARAASSYGKVFGEADGVVSCPKGQYHGAACWLPYSEEQLAMVEGIIGALARAYPTITEVVGHHHVSPGRKVDPTPLMDWQRMRQALGTRQTAPNADLVKQAQQALVKLGYHLGSVDGNMGPRTRAALRTFQEQNSLPISGEVTADTFDLLTNADKLGAKEMPTGSRDEVVAVRAGQSTDTWLLKWAAKAGLGFKAGEGVADIAENIGKASDALKTAEEAKGVIERFGEIAAWALGWAVTPRGLSIIATMVVIAGGWWVIKRVERRRAAAARSGALLEA